MPDVKQRKGRLIAVLGDKERTAKNSLTPWSVFLAKFKSVYKHGDRLIGLGCVVGPDQYAESVAKCIGGMSLTIYVPSLPTNKKDMDEMRSRVIDECDVLIAMPVEKRNGECEKWIKLAKTLGKEIHYA